MKNEIPQSLTEPTSSQIEVNINDLLEQLPSELQDRWIEETQGMPDTQALLLLEQKIEGRKNIKNTWRKQGEIFFLFQEGNY